MFERVGAFNADQCFPSVHTGHIDIKNDQAGQSAHDMGLL